MLTINKKPYNLSFAGNQVQYLVNSGNAFLTQGDNAIFFLRVNGKDMSKGHTFKLSFLEKILIFTISSGGGDDPLLIPQATTSDSYATWAQTIFDAFSANYDLISNYRLILHDPLSGERLIEFLALVPGPQSNVVFTNTNTTGLLAGQTEPGIAPVPRVNFGILMQLRLSDMQTIIGEDFKPVDIRGNVVFDISEYLRSALATMEDNYPVRFIYPDDTAGPFALRQNYITHYVAMFAERYEAYVSKLTIDAERRAIGGGLNRESIISYSQNSIDFFASGLVTKAFLTHLPLTKQTYNNVPEKLFFLYQEEKTTAILKIKLRCYCSDTTTAEFLYSQVWPLPPYCVIEIMVGYEHLKFSHLVPGKSVIAWDIRLQNQDGLDVSEVRRFELDQKWYEHPRVFLYRNSFTAYDVVFFTGERERSAENDLIISSRANQQVPSAINTPAFKSSSDETQTFKMSSGWISDEMRESLRDFLLSGEVYEITNGQAIAIIITSKKVPLDKDKEGLIAIDFEYRRANTDSFYSKPYGMTSWNDDHVMLDSDTWSDLKEETTN
jgi:hypothetical protein